MFSLKGDLMDMKKYVNEKVVSDITGIAIQTLRNQRFFRRGIPYHKIGKAVRYSLDDVYRYLDSKKIKTEDL